MKRYETARASLKATIKYLNESDSCNQIFKSKQRYNILHLYFGRRKLHCITRERIRQIIQKEIMKLSRFPTVSNLISAMLLFEQYIFSQFISKKENENFDDLDIKLRLSSNHFCSAAFMGCGAVIVSAPGNLNLTFGTNSFEPITL